jgi:hypothetical protein
MHTTPYVIHVRGFFCAINELTKCLKVCITYQAFKSKGGHMLSRKISRIGAYLVLGLLAVIIVLTLAVAIIDFFTSHPDALTTLIGTVAILIGFLVVWVTMPRRESCPNCETGVLTKRYMREMDNGSAVDEAYCSTCGHVDHVVIRPASTTK